jgi:hypothetical protein
LIITHSGGSAGHPEFQLLLAKFNAKRFKSTVEVWTPRNATFAVADRRKLRHTYSKVLCHHEIPRKGDKGLPTTIRFWIRPCQHFSLFKSKIRIGRMIRDKAHNFERSLEMWECSLFLRTFWTSHSRRTPKKTVAHRWPRTIILTLICCANCIFHE